MRRWLGSRRGEWSRVAAPCQARPRNGEQTDTRPSYAHRLRKIGLAAFAGTVGSPVTIPATHAIDPTVGAVVLRKAEAVVSLSALREAEMLEIGGVTLARRKGQASALEAARTSAGRDVRAVTGMRDGKDVAYDVTLAFVPHAFTSDIEVWC